MRLRLIHSAKETVETPVHEPRVDRVKLVLLVVGIFFCLKLPMCFVTHNPEELRDYDHYVKTASGEFAYKDFVWLYGPVTPLVYGTVMKIFPNRLVTVRIFSLLLWSLGALSLGLLFARYLSGYRQVLFATFFASAVFGYPSYSHNHILPAVATLASTYFLLKFMDDGAESDLFLSFGCLLVCFFARPVLMGYGLYAAWMGLFIFQPRHADRLRMVIGFLAVTGLCFLLFLLIYGPNLVTAFMPQPWAVLETKGYPNLSNLVPRPHFSSANWFTQFGKQCRAALETGVFYLHYFVWPTFVFTQAYVFRNRPRLQAAGTTMLIGLAVSADLLHYGFVQPMNENAMWVRGQYFFALTAVSLFLVLWPAVMETHREKAIRFVSALGLVVITVWGYLPFFVGWSHFAKFNFNEYGFTAMQGILTHRDRSAVLQAVSHINARCDIHDKVVVAQYDPGLGQLLNCKELFGEDAYIFTRMPWYELSAGETPYAPAGGISNGAVIDRRIAEEGPRFYLIQGDSPLLSRCKEPGWSMATFGTGLELRTVCWRERS